MNNAGSMAEAALKLNGIFEAADAAAAQYIKSVSDGDVVYNAPPAAVLHGSEEIIAEAKKKSQQMLDKTEEKCRAREEKAQKYVDAVNAKLKQLYTDYKELFILLQNTMKSGATGEKKTDFSWRRRIRSENFYNLRQRFPFAGAAFYIKVT